MNTEQMIQIIDSIAQTHNVSRNKLLEACGARSYVDNLKKGRSPNVETTARIADYLNVSIDYLVGRTDNPEINK